MSPYSLKMKSQYGKLTTKQLHGFHLSHNIQCHNAVKVIQMHYLAQQYSAVSDLGVKDFIKRQSSEEETVWEHLKLLLSLGRQSSLKRDKPKKSYKNPKQDRQIVKICIFCFYLVLTSFKLFSCLSRLLLFLQAIRYFVCFFITFNFELLLQQSHNNHSSQMKR